ncbi:GNAT family N-acetyltransferase [Marinobacterium aestuariivivens]
MSVLQGFVFVDQQQHDLKAFDCGEPGMNQFLARFACRDMKLGISATWGLPTDEAAAEEKTRLAAYYTLASATVTRDQIPEKKLPPYAIPVTLLAKLAVDVRYQNQGLGEKSLISALRHAVRLSDTGLPAVGVTLDVLNDAALRFYQQFEIFEPFTRDPMRLFVPMRVLREI